jgi:NADP-dependent 3-hydroxy acid dehydrogenase YdfG
MTDLSGRTAVVTGASSGIGAAVARRLAADGASVALLARRAELVEALAAEVGGLAVPADVSVPAELDRAAAAVRDRLGPPDLVVANAGVLLTDPAADADPAGAAAMVTTNLTGAAWTARLFLPDLRAAGAAGRPADLVFVGTPGGVPLISVYEATKAAVSQLARALRKELAPAAVRVHDVEPSWTTTPLADALVAELAALAPPAEEPPPGPMPPPLSPEDVADAIAYCVAAPPNVTISHLALAPTWLP